MKQSAAQVPIHTYQRKAAIASGEVRDHAGSVAVVPIKDFDLNRTIFNTLEGRLPRYVMQTRIAKQVHWRAEDRQAIESAYQRSSRGVDLPQIEPELIRFMVDECDFDVEHADGSFLDHLYFCYEYTHHYFPDHSPLVMLLHSILGTGTNTFAMTAEKMPRLRELVNEFEWRHIEAFPTVLRLLYDGGIRSDLWANLQRLHELQSVHFHRVIDNQPLVMSAQDFWIQLNYQMIHLIDFLPVANWSTHLNDTSFIVFRDLFGLLMKAGRQQAQIGYQEPGGAKPIGESQGMASRLISLIPVKLSEKMAAKSIRKFSAQIEHSLAYELVWS
ncbi:MAG: hypothetical protein VYA30_02000 [Myxococcota bacterium]|nr:hypothetical protein [Myxococcota bacterium]